MYKRNIKHTLYLWPIKLCSCANLADFSGAVMRGELSKLHPKSAN